MKRILFCISLAASLHAQALTYYFSTTDGDDTRTATQAHSANTPWKTFNSKASSMAAGDSVLFKSGDVFDSVNVTKGFKIASYGAGAKPLFSGMYTITTWTSLGNGIYESEAIPTSIPLNMVTINNTPYAVGRYPNIDAGNGGYLIFESHSQTNSADPDTITDNTHSTVLDNTYTGAQVVMKTTLSNISTATITSITGTTNTSIGYTALTPAWTLSNNYGYFVQKSIKTLDQFGEWYFNPSTKKIAVFFGSAGAASNVVKVATKDKMILVGTSGISFSNIAVQGSNYGIYTQISSLSGLTIDSCDLSYFGFDAIAYRGMTHSSITNCKINWVHSCGMNLWNSNTYIDILNNTVSNVGMFPGHTAKDIGSIASVGIATASSDSVTVKYNTLKNGGHHGIRFDEANNYLSQYNTIDSFLQIMDDGGSIYFWVSTSPKGALHDRYVLNNTVTNAIDNEYGAPAGTSYYGGIYGDDRVYNVVIKGNTVANGNGSGIFLHNAHDVTVYGNLLFNNSNGFTTQHDNSSYAFNNMVIKKNQVFAKTATQLLVNLRSSYNDFSSIGTWDSNYYCRPFNEAGVFMRTWFSNTASNYDLISTSGTSTDWKTFIGGDAHSVKTPVAVADASKIQFRVTASYPRVQRFCCTTFTGADGTNYPPVFTLQPYSGYILLAH